MKWNGSRRSALFVVDEAHCVSERSPTSGLNCTSPRTTTPTPTSGNDQSVQRIQQRPTTTHSKIFSKLGDART
jgi:hypothetical protein